MNHFSLHPFSMLFMVLQTSTDCPLNYLYPKVKDPYLYKLILKAFPQVLVGPP